MSLLESEYEFQVITATSNYKGCLCGEIREVALGNWDWAEPRKRGGFLAQGGGMGWCPWKDPLGQVQWWEGEKCVQGTGQEQCSLNADSDWGSAPEDAVRLASFTQCHLFHGCLCLLKRDLKLLKCLEQSPDQILKKLVLVFLEKKKKNKTSA